MSVQWLNINFQKKKKKEKLDQKADKENEILPFGWRGLFRDISEFINITFCTELLMNAHTYVVTIA